MSTNYYARVSTCANPEHDDLFHIGKSSGGWRFLFRAYPDLNLTSVNRWHDHLIGKHIVDEYGTAVELHDLFEIVRRKRNDKNHSDARHEQLADLAFWEFC